MGRVPGLATPAMLGAVGSVARRGRLFASAVFGLGAVISLTGCTRDNPLFADTDAVGGTGRGDTTSAGSAPSTTQNASGTGLSTTEATTTTKGTSAGVTSRPPDSTSDPSDGRTVTTTFGRETDTRDETSTDEGCRTLLPCGGLGDDSCPVQTKCAPVPGDSSLPGVWEYFACLPLEGEPGTQGESCESAACRDGPNGSAFDTCAAGLGCVNGICKPLCQQTLDCPSNVACLPNPISVVNLCDVPCNPFAQDCSDGYGCFPTGDGGTLCMPAAGNVGAGEECGFLNECQLGLVCAPEGFVLGCDDMMCCARYCSLSASDCPDPTICSPLFMSPAPGYEDVGICAAPMMGG